ncbi:cytochrome c assembly protein [Marivirga tractuosa]|uniref:Cytochrome c assembly protein n=1 Tax=Marivirga tractuosa (strain ATCC 23168 / DSM 4126 / NBRC 15989 / NCIMB 1408 / VKM B-1430 / H-43) TaxID=643867 RepID=E4TN47_MARTH|nr:cytochrome c biogenesis protein CcsA [Marivirga tractuosa]ADR22461.1 cytochrome c assembly protein [Marivirga tractuosa DSM 4126]BDD16868.1 cytochrome c assembly protein [Marivirga tractuosa]
MIHTTIGDIGHLFVIISFVAALISIFNFYKAEKSPLPEMQKGWMKNGQITYIIHGLAVFGIVITLFTIISNHYYEYFYAWSHSSKVLPVEYIISSFWEGQEGSFLLWSFWNVLLGFIILLTNKKWAPSVMVSFSVVQAFLASMILGVVIGDFKIGSSPFILLRDAMDAPIFNINPDYVPEDGTGLNPLLQNYWMVIHPPVLFLGYATTLIPFAYAIAGLWKKDFKGWVRPALPWALFSASILGVGILMGGYWAYETLNFEGFWNWDPVENASLVPWLVLVASIHTMITYKKSETALKASIILVLSVFLMVLYATFMVRSGVLGESSVHSFTDLGLSGQLLLYLLSFLIVSIVLAVVRWKHIPSTEKEVSTYSREFWIFMGATLLCLMGFQILLPTSIPVYNSIIQSFGGISNLAPPADQIAFYTKWQMWFAIGLAILSGTGQFFWWQKMKKSEVKESLLFPILITLVVSALIIVLGRITNIPYILLIIASIYTIAANAKIFIKIVRSNYKLSGGAIAHIGIGMMLLGILFSTGYSRTISLNETGLLLTNSEEVEDNFNQENIPLFINDPQTMGEYTLTYKGRFFETYDGGYVKAGYLENTPDENSKIVKRKIQREDESLNVGDTLQVYGANHYYKVDYLHANGDKFSLFPRAQINADMGGLISSPDIKRKLTKDLYTHVSSVPDPTQEIEWSEAKEMEVTFGEKFFLNDFVTVLEEVNRVDEIEGEKLKGNDLAVRATIKVYGDGEDYILNPYYLIRDNMAGRISDENREIGVKLNIENIKPESNTFTLSVRTTQKDYIILKALEKPLINLLWIGTLVLTIGFGMAIYRRYSEFYKMKRKGLE